MILVLLSVWALHILFSQHLWIKLSASRDAATSPCFTMDGPESRDSSIWCPFPGRLWKQRPLESCACALGSVAGWVIYICWQQQEEALCKTK